MRDDGGQRQHVDVMSNSDSPTLAGADERQPAQEIERSLDALSRP
jgi:hypothetical protein